VKNLGESNFEFLANKSKQKGIYARVQIGEDLNKVKYDQPNRYCPKGQNNIEDEEAKPTDNKRSNHQNHLLCHTVISLQFRSSSPSLNNTTVPHSLIDVEVRKDD
jgi:hypothetical protein